MIIYRHFFVGIDLAKACVTAFLTTDFAGGRHQARVDLLTPAKDA